MYSESKEIIMENFINILQKVFIFDKEPQKIGLCQFKEPEKVKKEEKPSIKNKDIKLSDLMRKG